MSNVGSDVGITGPEAPAPPEKRGWGAIALGVLLLGAVGSVVVDDLAHRFSSSRCVSAFCWRTDTTATTVAVDIKNRRSGKLVTSTHRTYFRCPAHPQATESALVAVAGYVYVLLFMILVGGVIVLVTRMSGPALQGTAATPATWYPPWGALPGLLGMGILCGSAITLSQPVFDDPYNQIAGWLLVVLGGLIGILMVPAMFGKGPPYFILLLGSVIFGPMLVFWLNEVVAWTTGLPVLGAGIAGMIVGYRPFLRWSKALEAARKERRRAAAPVSRAPRPGLRPRLRSPGSGASEAPAEE